MLLLLLESDPTPLMTNKTKCTYIKRERKISSQIKIAASGFGAYPYLQPHCWRKRHSTQSHQPCRDLEILY